MDILMMLIKTGYKIYRGKLQLDKKQMMKTIENGLQIIIFFTLYYVSRFLQIKK